MRLAICIAIFVCTTLTPGRANAQFVDIGNNVTRYMASGLDWLSPGAANAGATFCVTETFQLGMQTAEVCTWSVSEILAGAGGWIENGWRYATTEEICDLYDAFDLALSACPGTGEPQVGAVFDYQDFLGTTYFECVVFLGCSFRRTGGFFDDGDLLDGLAGVASASTTGVNQFVIATSSTVGLNLGGTDFHASTRITRNGHHLVRPTPPSSPVHRWKFDEPAGMAPDGTAVEDARTGLAGVVRGNGASFTGAELRLPGGFSFIQAYVDLPNGLISQLTDATLEGWFTVDGLRSWARLFDSGSSNDQEVPPGGGGMGTDFFFLSATQGSDVNLQRTEIGNLDPIGGGPATRSGLAGDTNAPTTLGQRYHFAVTLDADGGGPGTARVTTYRDGEPINQFDTPIQLAHLNDVNNWLGRSNFTTDENLEGRLHEFRIYDAALSPSQVGNSFVAGPDAILAPEPTHPAWAALGALAILANRRRLAAPELTHTSAPAFPHSASANATPVPPRPQ